MMSLQIEDEVQMVVFVRKDEKVLLLFKSHEITYLQYHSNNVSTFFSITSVLNFPQRITLLWTDGIIGMLKPWQRLQIVSQSKWMQMQVQPTAWFVS